MKVEPVEVPSVATTSRAPPPSLPRFFFPSLSPNLQLPYPPHHHHLQHLLGKLEPPQFDQQQHEEDSKPLVFNTSIFSQHHSTSFLAGQEQQHLQEAAGARKKSAGSPAGKQQPAAAFTCQKCGKSYNWNYNLNRHMRFECGIENKFECSVCHKRFPYKQNAAIHLKRKHKLMMENADDMLAAGHIVLMAGMPRNST